MVRFVAYITFCLTLVLSPLLVGGVHLVVFVVMGGLLALSITASLSTQSQVRISPLFLAFALAVVVALVQQIPLPATLLSVLSPTGHEQAEITRELLGLEWSWRSISMDPDASLDRVVRWGVLAAMIFAAGNLPSKSNAHRWLMGAVVGGGVASLVMGVIQKSIDAELILGFYKARVPSSFASTFVNWNHSASLYVLISLIAGFLALNRRRDARERAVLVSIGVVFLGASWLNQSVSARVLSASACVFFLCVSVVRWRRWVVIPRAKRLMAVWAGALLTIAGFVVTWLVGGRWRQVGGIGDSIQARTALASGAWRASLDYLIAGCGAGATERVIYPSMDWSRTQAAQIVVVENDLLGLWLELGVFAASAFLALLLIAALGPLLRGAASEQWRETYSEAGVIALFALIIMQMHFPLWALGLGGPLFVVWEVARCRALRGVRPERRSGLVAVVLRASNLRVSRRFAAMILLALGVAVASSAVTTFRSPGTRDADIFKMDEAALVQLARRAPTEASMFMRYAVLTKADPARASALMERAFLLEPRPRVQATWALFLAKSGQHDLALKHNREVLMGPRQEHVDKLIPLMLEGTRDAQKRASLFGEGGIERWRDVGKLILRREGPSAQASFALAILESRGEDLDAYVYLLDVYEQNKQVELVNIWAMYLLEANLEQKVEAREEALWRMARQRTARGRKEAVRFIEEALSSLPERAHGRLERLLVSMVDVSDILAFSRKELALFDARRARACLGRGEVAVRYRCALAKAASAESRGNLEEAESLFKQANYLSKSSLALPMFYVRQKHCLKLRSFATRAESDIKEARLAKLIDQCY